MLSYIRGTLPKISCMFCPQKRSDDGIQYMSKLVTFHIDVL